MNERHVFRFGLVCGAASFLQLSAVCNDDGLCWPVHGCSLGVLDGLHDVKAFHDLSEDGVPSVQPRGRHCADEELGTVGVWPRVGHAQHARSSVLKVEVLVGEGSAVDALAPRSVSCGEVSSLDHEVLDDSVELAALVSEAGLAGAELAEVLGGLGDVVAEEPHHHAPGGHAADFNVEVHLGGDVRDRALVRGGGGGPEARGRGSGRHHVGRLPRGPRPRGRSEAALWLRAWPAGARSQAAVGSELPRRPHHTLHRRRHVVLPFSLAELISTPVPSSVVVVRRLSSTRHSLTHSLTRVVVALSLSLTASLRLCCACLQKRG
mmetsp:Transcript_10872/g.22634  ORF Transcript_10872/g.22634 Transcript_10872/m.22634 type:complete len:321 (+) Transcript_10872:56-1018(+)